MINLKIDKSNLDLYNNDCINTLSTIKTESIDCIITDSPYGISYNNKFHSPGEKGWDNFSKQEYISFTVKWMSEAYRVLKPTGTLWTFFAPTMVQEMFEIISKTKFYNHLENWTNYARESGRGASKKLKSVREDIFHLTKDPNIHTWNSVEWLRRVIAPYKMAGGIKRGWDYLEDGKTPARWTGSGNIVPFLTELEYEKNAAKKGTILDLGSGLPMRYSGTPSDVTFFNNPSYNNKFDTAIHSCQKPILLLSMLTMISSLEGETILDPFMGSGSQAIASVICNRNFIGIEREKETFDKASNWIENFDYDLTERYFKTRISSSEQNFKFGFDKRTFMKK
jgi:site-specific DNA-methyltransferase (adenine-specific)